MSSIFKSKPQLRTNYNLQLKLQHYVSHLQSQVRSRTCQQVLKTNYIFNIKGIKVIPKCLLDLRTTNNILKRYWIFSLKIICSILFYNSWNHFKIFKLTLMVLSLVCLLNCWKGHFDWRSCRLKVIKKIIKQKFML